MATFFKLPILLFVFVLVTNNLTNAKECNCNSILSTPSDPLQSSTNSVTTLYNIILQLLEDASGFPQKIGVVTASMFDAYALTTGEYNATTDICLPNLKQTSVDDNIVYAAYTSMSMIFKAEPQKLFLLNSYMQLYGYPIEDITGQVGAIIARATLMKYKLSMPDVPFRPTNPASSTYDASCSTIKHSDDWQPQCIQSMAGMKCKYQKIPFNKFLNAPLFSSDGDTNISSILSKLEAPPTYTKPLSTLPFTSGSNDFADQYLKVLNTSSRLSDWHKIHSEFFAPNAVFQIARLALNEVVSRNLTLSQSISTLFLTSMATRDAVAASVTAKLKYNTARPISILQCAYTNRSIKAWKGPYQGVQTFINGKDGEKWIPYLTTPPFPGYVSGHSVVASAGAYVLSKMFKDGPRAANCHVVMPGMSKMEPRIEKGAMGYVKGVTDVANKGPQSIGYSPSKKVTVCWSSWEEFAAQLAQSRLFGGIHIPLDNEEGRSLGSVVGKKAYQYFQDMKLK